MKPPQDAKIELSGRQLAIIRVSLLRYIARGEECLSAGYLVAFIRAEGFRRFSEEECRKQLDFLMAAKLITEIQNPIAPESRHWRITSEGLDLLAKQTGE